MTLSERIRQTLASRGDKAFEVDGAWIGWDAVAAVADRVRALLAEAGIGPRAPIGLIGRNRIGSASAFLGILAGERCVVPINPFQSERRILEDVDRVEIAALIGEPEDFRSGALVAAMALRGVAIIVVDGIDPADVGIVLERGDGPVPDSGTTALLIPTSGTTGVPKRIPIRFDTLAAANADAERSAIEFGEAEGPVETKSALVQYSPLVHITGSLGVSRCGSEGRRLVLLEKFTPEAWVDAIERNRVAVAGLPPTMMRMVLALDPPPERLASLTSIWSGSSPVDLDVVRTFERRYDLVVLGNYGATEFCGVVASGSVADRTRFGSAKEHSVGRANRAVADFRVLDPSSGAPVADGERGVLELRVHRIGSDWMRTSDLVSIDADDFLYIHGRADDAINRGGFKVVPSIIGDALKRYPGVIDVAVVGIPDARLGEVPVAAVEMDSADPDADGEALLRFARQELIAYQVPTRIRVLPSLPRTPSFKVDKREVKALFGVAS